MKSETARDINESRKRQDTIDEKKTRIISELADILPTNALKFVSTQIRIGSRKPRGIRWTSAEKRIALSLMHSSPKTYLLLSKILHLPSFTTLRRTMKGVQVYPGFNEKIMKVLSDKVSSLKYGKLCSVVFDEMVLKEGLSYNEEKDYVEGVEDFGDQRTHFVANHATVFMVRGLCQPWKQPVEYFFVKRPNQW